MKSAGTRTYAPGTICDRCGMEKKEVKRTQFECNVYGRPYGNHSYNREELIVKIQIFADHKKQS